MDMVEVGRRVKAALEYADMSQAQCARKIGVHQMTISRIVRGEREGGTTFETMAGIARVTGVSLDYLAGQSWPQPDRLPMHPPSEAFNQS